MKYWFLSGLLWLCVSLAYGQRFSAGIVLGLNASQIQGDQLAGFDKLGLTGGIKGIAELQEKLDLNVEILYSQRGSRPDIFSATVDPNVKIHLQYLELPVTLSYKDWLHEEDGYYRVHIHGGLSYARLIEARTFDRFNPEEENLDGLVAFFNDNDFSFILGAGYQASRHINFLFRYTRSITLLLNSDKDNLPVPPLRPYSLTFRAEYIF